MVAKLQADEGRPRVRDGTAEDIDALVTILCDSFAEDPMLNWVIPQRALYPDYFALLLREVYLPRGIVHIEARGRATALWLPPEQRLEIAPHAALLQLGWRLLRSAGPRPLGRLWQQSRIFARYLPAEPHYALHYLGCRHDSQGRGLGSAVLQHGIDLCDVHSMPAQLESSSTRSVPLYERLGFAVYGEAALAPTGPTVYFMWRAPQ